MGYVNDVNFAQFISPFEFGYTAGTWTVTVATNVVCNVRTAGDASFTALVPVKIPSNTVELKGARLKSIDVWYKIGTAAADDFATVTLEKMNLKVDASVVTGAAVTAVTIDTAHNTDAKRLAQGDHKMTVTLDTPVWVLPTEQYWLTLIVNAALTTAFRFFGASANYELRV